MIKLVRYIPSIYDIRDPQAKLNVYTIYDKYDIPKTIKSVIFILYTTRRINMLRRYTIKSTYDIPYTIFNIRYTLYDIPYTIYLT